MTLPEAGKPSFFLSVGFSLLVAFTALTTICYLFYLFIIYLLYQVINSMRARTLSFALLRASLFGSSWYSEVQ